MRGRERAVGERFELFIHLSRELQEEALLKGGSNVSLTIDWDQLTGMRMKLQTPRREDLRSALMVLRKFVSDKASVHLGRIYNLAQQHVDSEELRGLLVKSRATWTSAQKSSSMTLSVDGRALTPEHIADLLINGEYFHDDVNKQDELRRLMPDVGAFMHFEFVNYVFTLIKVVMHVASVLLEARTSGLLRG